MGLYKRGKVWWVAYTVGERQRRVSTKQTAKKKAEEVWTRLSVSLLDGSYVPEAKRPSILEAPPWEIAIKSYLEDRDRRGKRADSYRKLADWREALKGRSVRDVTLGDVEAKLSEWMKDRRWSPATYNNALSQVSGVLSYAYRRAWIDRHPLRGRAERMEANNARERWLRTVEVEAIRAAALDVARKKTPAAPEDWLSNIVAAAVGTGLRRGVLCALTCADVERTEGEDLYLYVGRDKNGEPIHKPVLGGLLAIVKARLEDAVGAAILFPGPGDGNPYTAVGRFLPLAVRYASMRTPGLTLRWGRKRRDGITFHTFRHSMASLAANSGVPLDVVQRMGNWKTPAMMRRYAHLADERIAEGEARLAEVLTGPRAAKRYHALSHSGKASKPANVVSG